MRFVREHAYETVLAVLILVFGGSIVAFYRSVTEAVSAYPAQVAMLAALAALVGAFLYSLLDRKESLVERERQKGETERERMRLEKEEGNRKREEKEREIAEAKAIVDAEARELAALDQFTDTQLGMMLRVLDADSPGLRTRILSDDDKVATQLLESQVVRYSGDSNRQSIWILVPKWRAWTVKHRADIENRLGI